MRYKELQAAREILINAAKYLHDSFDNSGLFARDSYIAALEVIHEAITEVREEIKHPERFNLDGTRRVVKMFDSSKGPIA